MFLTQRTQYCQFPVWGLQSTLSTGTPVAFHRRLKDQIPGTTVGQQLLDLCEKSWKKKLHDNKRKRRIGFLSKGTRSDPASEKLL